MMHLTEASLPPESSRRGARPSRRRGISLWLFLSVVLTASLAAAESESGPTATLPYTPSLDPKAMDTTADPCENLYQYACGNWLKLNPIPDDQSSWSVYGKAYVDNQRYLWGILEDVAVERPGRSSTQALIGDYFAACMDLTTIDSLGSSPLDNDLRAIDQVTDKKQLGELLGRLIEHTDSANFFFGLGSQQDAEQSTTMIGAIFAGGLGLPDREYYFEPGENQESIRKAYREHVVAMFKLLGESVEQATQSAEIVWRIESALAGATLTILEKRDPRKVYHRYTLDELVALSPGINWHSLFRQTALEAEPWLNITQPDFMREAEATIGRESLPALQTYLKWGLLNTRAELLAKPFRDQDFAFYGTRLRGVTEQPPRWRTCVGKVDSQLGEALGREFVERNFPPALREDALRMSLQIQEAMSERLNSIAWMSPETRAQAHDKLAKMREKIGYPDNWRDYSSIFLDRKDYFGNVTRATGFDFRRQLHRIGKPVDREEWFMTPTTVNAYYNTSMNDMNFPAGVLMPPLYDPRLDDAPNYGNTGGTIGHELVHGFDDEGRQFDGDGNLRDWWTAEDAKAFEERADCIREQYAGYRVIDDVFINSRLTAGEDIADLGGLILAWDAWKKETASESLPSQDGLSPEQRFFVGFAQWACAFERPESLRVHAATDPHSPPEYRVNGVVVNMPQYAKAFNCKAGDAMVKPAEKVCRIW